MTTYAPVPPFASKSRHPRALMVIVGVHAAAIAAVMTVKMDLPVPWDPTVTKVELVPEHKPPPENVPPQPRADPKKSAIDQPAPLVPVPQPKIPPVESLPHPLPLPDPGVIIGPGTGAQPNPQPRPAPVRIGPRFATPDSLLKPPYPASKLRMDEEAVLRLRLTIDERGRVTAVDPVGNADRVFLAAARRHLIANWRYQPATEDGRPVASSTVITLRFQLDD